MDAVLNKSKNKPFKKTAVEEPLTSHLINHSRKMNKTYCRRSKNKIMCNTFLWTTIHELTNVG